MAVPLPRTLECLDYRYVSSYPSSFHLEIPRVNWSIKDKKKVDIIAMDLMPGVSVRTWSYLYIILGSFQTLKQSTHHVFPRSRLSLPPSLGHFSYFSDLCGLIKRQITGESLFSFAIWGFDSPWWGNVTRMALHCSGWHEGSCSHLGRSEHQQKIGSGAGL